ncbi:unnamed protein product [Durusdinium trenchii]|uniref:Uncharacterized protein n=1 Tax=Durusdinium trenchii TaxID=1381693 RepID=A0ABP0P5E5_9DINO
MLLVLLWHLHSLHPMGPPGHLDHAMRRDHLSCDWTPSWAVPKQEEPQDLCVEHILASNAIADGTITPYEMGTSLNMNVDPALNIDLTGAWWMDGNPAIFEQVVSFAGAVGAAPFPVSIPMPTNFKGRWTYSDTLLARLVMAYHAWTTAVNDAHLFMFANSTSAEIVPVAQAAFGGAELWLQQNQQRRMEPRGCLHSAADHLRGRYATSGLLAELLELVSQHPA